MNFNNITSGFGVRFKKILNDHNITQSRFSKETGTHPGLVSRYINGESPSGDFIIKAVGYFPEEIQYLFFGSPNDKVEEEASNYSADPFDIIKDIELKLNALKAVLPQE